MGGPGYMLWEKNTNYVVVFKPKEGVGPEEFRRMVYQFKPRSQQDPTFGIFECPDAALARPAEPRGQRKQKVPAASPPDPPPG